VLQLNVPGREHSRELLCTQVNQSQETAGEEGFMIYVRETMIDFLQYRNILIILDAVSSSLAGTGLTSPLNRA
jgi:hypothetical protein